MTSSTPLALSFGMSLLLMGCASHASPSPATSAVTDAAGLRWPDGAAASLGSEYSDVLSAVGRHCQGGRPA